MGLASGQARLLSITARLTDNEYRSQRLTNARLNLSSISEEARVDYQEALNSNKFVYVAYNSSGRSEKTDLTPTVLWQYQPCKNQYALINTAGKILVSQEDGDNFKQTDTLVQFLDKYDLLNDYSEDYEKYKTDYAQYENDYAQWQEDMSQWEMNNSNYSAYLKELAKWQRDKNKVDLYEVFSGEVGTSVTATSSGGSFCYYSALNGDTGCYLHLLNELLDYDGGDCQPHDYLASCGYNGSYADSDRSFTTNASHGGMHNQGNTNDVMKEVSAGINDSEKLCDGDDDFIPDYSLNGDADDKEMFNILQAAIEAGRTPTPFEILVSDYIYNPDTQDCSQKKTIKQKAIDMYYIIQNIAKFPEANDSAVRKNMLINFTEGDLRNIVSDPPEPVEDPGDAPPEPQKPIKPTLYTDDKEKSQWYTNLWYRMNGFDNPQEIMTLAEEKTNAQYEDIETEKYIINLENIDKNAFSNSYEILPSNLAASKDWLNNVLSQGIVTMEKVGVTRTASENEFKWSSMIYSNTTDIITEEDSEAIAKAEVHYTQVLSDVEKKDKRYQMQLRSLDTEHNALQTEYSSVKSEVDKNISRSFKVFQG